MCGIFGEFTISSKLLDASAFMALNQLSYLRGPDSSGHYCNDKNVQLGFNRLAILDLSENGSQPMHSPSRRYTVVFNGEIYNHLDLRKKLKDYNVSYKGTSDTETLVTALDHWGVEESIKLLDGMFGIAVFDHEQNCIHLARDFAGIKPLHYGIYNNHLVFASQYDQVSHHPQFLNQAIDEGVLKLYLKQHYVPAPFGILKNTYQVLPGEIITINADFNISKIRYWELSAEESSEITDTKQALEYIENHLEQSVKDELMADVPLGAFLSGGIDSPLICHYAQKNFPTQLKAFTIGSDSKVHDESEDAKTYGEFIGLDMLLREMKGETAMNELEQAMNCLSEPFADPSIIPTYLVSKLAKEKVTVALSGDGGDELFFGYERFWSVIKNRPFHQLPKSLRYLVYGSDKVLFNNKHVNSNLLLDTYGQGHFQGHSRMSDQLVDAIFPDLQNVKIPEAFNVYSYDDTKTERQLLGAMRKAEFYGMMQKTLLKVDRASMANSLEIRVPFLKKSFIEATLKVDPYLSYGPNRKKDMLKQLLAKNYPDSPIDNRKRGFSIPLHNWIRTGLKPIFEDTLLNEKSTEEFFGVDHAKMSELFGQHITSKTDAKWPLFTIYSLYNWKKCLGK